MESLLKLIKDKNYKKNYLFSRIIENPLKMCLILAMKLLQKYLTWKRRNLIQLTAWEKCTKSLNGLTNYIESHQV